MQRLKLQCLHFQSSCKQGVCFSLSNLVQLILVSSSVAFFSKQHDDTQWWEISTALYIPPQRPDFKAIYVSEQDTRKSIKMAHQTFPYLYLSLYMYMVFVSKGAVIGNADGSEDDMG